MFEDKARTPISELGEFGLIKHLSEHIKTKHPETFKGIGDDAAVLEHGGEQTVVSTDMLMEGVHFNLSYCPLKHLGYKAVVVNLSDIYAMNAKPLQITVSIALSSRFTVEAVEELYAGILLAAENYGIDVVGGDTTSSMSGLAISITAIGVGQKDDLVYRNGAKANDLVVVSGDFGGAYMGLQMLERERSVFEENPEVQPDLDGKDYILQRQLKPEARKDVIEMFRKMVLKPTSMIDVSDGLSSELLHLCDQSEVGCQIYEEKLPIDPTVVQTAMDFNLDPTMCCLSGGEDYELLFTIDQREYEKLKGSPHFTVIGHITGKGEGAYMYSKGNQQVELKAQGWNPLLKN